MSFEKEIAEFFVDYVAAFARNDADALSELWNAVGLFPNVARARMAYQMHGEGDELVAEWSTSISCAMAIAGGFS